MQAWQRRLVDASALVAFLGLAFVVGGVVLWMVELAPAADTAHAALYDLVVHVLFGGVILALGVHVERSELVDEERFSVMAWCYGGFTLMFVLSFWGHLGSILAGELTVDFVSDFLVYTSLGGAFGVVAGVNYGRATRNQRLAARNEEQRETLALLTRLVSHDVRNDMAVVKGYAELLQETVDEAERETVDVIRDHVETTIELLEDASTLVKAIDQEREFEPIDLSEILAHEARSLKRDHPEIDVETDVPDGINVEADRLLHQLFSNLLGNAVAHNDVEGLTVSITAEQVGDSATVVVADDGRGVPDDVRDSIFELGERSADSDGDGIGLYLVSRLADLYGGSVDLEASSNGGARFRVRLPTTADDPSEQAPKAEVNPFAAET